MKLLLTSEGFTTDELIETTIRLVGKPAEDINLAIINEGYAVERKDHRWVLDELDHAAAIFGGTFQLVNLLALNPEHIKSRLQQADVIFCLGGHTDYLMSVFKKSGLADMLPELLESKVYVGSSAGSMIMGQRISAEAYHEIYAEEGTYGVERYLGLVDVAIKPHFNSPEWSKNRLSTLTEVLKDHPGTVYALDDTSALLVENGTITPIGEDWVKFVDGAPID